MFWIEIDPLRQPNERVRVFWISDCAVGAEFVVAVEDSVVVGVGIVAVAVAVQSIFVSQVDVQVHSEFALCAPETLPLSDLVSCAVVGVERDWEPFQFQPSNSFWNW